MLATLATIATLFVTVWPDGPAGEAQHHVVRCPGPAFCAQLTRPLFAPVPTDVACSEIYSGPEQALVTGRLNGRKVWARFRRTDSCQTQRWNRVAFLFRT